MLSPLFYATEKINTYLFCSSLGFHYLCRNILLKNYAYTKTAIFGLDVRCVVLSGGKGYLCVHFLS